MTERQPQDQPFSPLVVAMAGAVSLAVAMGIGRFAFTPLLPMMLADGVVDLAMASWLASANYFGYLVGALLCTFQPRIWARWPGLPAIDGPWLVRGGLAATGVLTVGMALPWPALWPALRFAAGVASALVFVYSSGWCLMQLARRGNTAMGGVMFTGPGAGIVVSGLLASVMVAWHWRAAAAWLLFGALAFALSATVWRIIRSEPHEAPEPHGAGRATSSPAADAAHEHHGRAEVASLTIAYGLAGFGYIITATFLPVIARAALPGSPWLDFFWPIFGLGVVVGALVSTRLRLTGDLRRHLIVAYLMQATGIAVSVWSPTLVGFAIGSLLLGLPFTAITFFAIQEVRRLRPATAASTMGLLTAVYGVGQIVGPPLAAALLRWSGSARAGFTLSLEIAAAALLVGALLYGWMMRAFPRDAAA
jgi:predicted MFS family arabinose efflux permease